ncbi:hypothetical protein [Evansella tamaricis]|uniref:Uncharacterized protein n=1 Tax=Evansella tamaricis TaxID=2069301 RepID=A0ABS6JE79_9BACI|nr:hypothetical protein [Evansella tamaricis]MBU9711974.1 hypothetical protein [Evansella tamaricis]
MKGFDVKTESNKSFKNITLLFFFVLILLLLLVVLLNVVFGTVTWESLYINIITSLISVMIPLVLFNLIYDYVTKSHQKIEISDSISKAFMLNKDILERFSTDSRKSFIKTSTESLLGEEEGKMLYTTLIAPYLENKYNFRRNFKYHICYSVEDDLHFKQINDLTFTSDDYYWVEEDLSFFRNMNVFQLRKRRITAGFSYWESDLEELFKGEGVFFRENLFIGEKEKHILQQLTNEQLKNFINEALNFKFELNDQPLDFEVENAANGFYLQFHFDHTIEATPDKEYKFKYKFRMPQLKTIKKFIAIVSEPTQHVDILFTHADKNARIVPIPFFDDSEAINYLPNNIVKIELSKWVLPRSGCVFIWDEHKASEKEQTKELTQKHQVG